MAGIRPPRGIVDLRQGETTAATRAFGDVVDRADERLLHTPDDHDALDTKALALAGLTLIGPTDHRAAATDAFHAARARTTAAGIVARVRRHLDANVEWPRRRHRQVI